MPDKFAPDTFTPGTGQPLFQRMLGKLKRDRDPATGDAPASMDEPNMDKMSKPMATPTPKARPEPAPPAPEPEPAPPAPEPEESAGVFDEGAAQQWAGLPDEGGKDYYYDYQPAKGDRPATITIHGGHRGIVPITITNAGRHADAFQAILKEARDLDASGTTLKPYIPVEELRKSADQAQTVDTVGRDAFADMMGPPNPFGESSTAERKVDTRTSPTMPSEPPTSPNVEYPSEDMTGPLTAPYDTRGSMGPVPTSDLTPMQAQALPGERKVDTRTSERFDMPSEDMTGPLTLPESPRAQSLTPEMRAGLSSPGTSGRPAQNRAQGGAEALDRFAQGVMADAGAAAGRVAAKDAALTGSDTLNRAQNMSIRIQNALQAGNAEEAAKLSEELQQLLENKAGAQ